MAKQIKEESVAYLKSWLGSLKESPEFLKTTLFEVKRATSMISQQIEAVQERIEAKPDIMDVDSDGNTHRRWRMRSGSLWVR